MGKTYSVYCGIDVGKFSHHFAAIVVATGELIFDGKIEQTESKIRATLEHINSHGDTLVVVDQPGSMSALLFAICDDMKIDKGFITPKAMSKAIDMYGGDLKTDAHDALVIAEVSSSLPKLIKPINEKSSLCKQLTTLMSYDRELTEESTRASNRLHDLLLSVCPGLEEYFGGKKIQTCFCLMILSRYGGPAGIKKAGKGNQKAFCINPACENFLPEDQRGYRRKPKAEQPVAVEGETLPEDFVCPLCKHGAADFEPIV